MLNIFKKKPQVKQEETIFKITPSQKIAQLPDVKDKENFDVRYPLIAPYSYAHVFWEKQSNELVYYVEEPKLDDSEQKILSMLESSIREIIDISFINVKEENIIIEYLEKNIRILLKEFGIKVTEDSLKRLMYYIYRDFVGLNQIEPLMKDYFIEDIECNGSKTPIYLVHRKYRHVRTNIVFSDNKILSNFVEKLAQKCGKYVSYANPLLDGRLPDSSRVNATYTQDISSRGPTFTIRKFTKEPWTPIKLIDFRTLSPEILAYLWLLMEYGTNIMVIGATASGKTSFLNAISFFIPPQSRIVSIEDTRELQLMHENWLPSVARAGIGLAAGKSHGAITIFELLKESFRQRPDYIIVGEIRGKEAFVLFQAAASGHPIMGTMHAEDVGTMMRRLETPPISLSPSLIESLDAVCVMSQAEVGKKVTRRLREVSEIVHLTSKGPQINKPFVWDPKLDKFYFKTNSAILDRISIKQGVPKEQLINEFRVRTKLLWAMYQNKVFGFKEVQEIINSYYKTPEQVLRKFKII
jgi:flagellar protein FlaI|tara:strand:+ start:38836 stop:40410 length:1575 start_codon:yes stop_codon:yes gene_type:complete